MSQVTLLFLRYAERIVSTSPNRARRVSVALADTKPSIPAVIAGVACLAMMSASILGGVCTGNCAEMPPEVSGDPQALSLEQTSRLDQKSFDQSLRELRTAIDRTNPSSGVNRETVTALQRKLRQADESSADYWPTVLRFLQFASSSIALKAPPPGEHAKVLSDVLGVGLMRGIRDFDKTYLFDGGSFGNSSFTNCRIVFTGNPVEMQGVVFKICVFEFPASGTPSSYLKKLCRILLASDLAEVSVKDLRADSR